MVGLALRPLGSKGISESTETGIGNAGADTSAFSCNFK
jgi:hypothetical protein